MSGTRQTIAAVDSPRLAAGLIQNARSLLGHGLVELRSVILDVANAGLAACDPAAATERVVGVESERLEVDGVSYPLKPSTRIIVLGAGKASLSIAGALERILGGRLSSGTVVVRSGQEANGALERVDVVVADHPLPTERSVGAAERLLAEAAAAGPDDIVIGCFTGGSSALASLPPRSVALAEKRLLHALLLRSGLPIVAVNTVRKHVSLVKGGRLAHAIAPARLINLTVSDVAGDPLDAITDPTVNDTTSPDSAVAILRGAGLWDEVPPAIRRHLATPEARSPRLRRDIQTVVLADGALACEAMAIAADARGFAPVVLSTSLEGEAQELGRFLGNLARESHLTGAPFAPPCVLIGCGGESMVTLGSDGQLGAGGPNQEAAIAAAIEIAGDVDVAAIFLDTDGSDGGTDVGGGIVDGASADRGRELGVDWRRALLEHRSTSALSALEDVVVTGPTMTNVNDLFAICIAAPSGREQGHP